VPEFEKRIPAFGAVVRGVGANCVAESTGDLMAEDRAIEICSDAKTLVE
jgi:hypothetical protein